jgi:hypothetical protein
MSPPSNPSPPDASRGNIILALHAVRNADRHQSFTNQMMRDYGIGQPRQAISFLQKLIRFVDDRKRVTSEVLDARTSLDAFQQLFEERVRQGCAACGLPEQLVSRLGEHDLDWPNLRAEFLRCPVLRDMSRNMQNNVTGALRAIDEIIRNVGDPRWLDGEAELISKVRSSKQAKQSHDSSYVIDQRTDSNEIIIPIPYYADDGNIVHAHLVVDRSYDVGDLDEIALHIRQIAQRLARRTHSTSEQISTSD